MQSKAEELQKQLDEYWSRHKTNREIGTLYERYVGYLYEIEGWKVDYNGARRYLEDRGRDLIAVKDKTCLVIQCKDYSRSKQIFEKHIFQLFGTAFNYQQIHPTLKVRPVFYTATRLSPFAKLVAGKLEVEVHEDVVLDRVKRFPSIKCNVSKFNGEKIFYLPFDKGYDKLRVDESSGEFFAVTVQEAEDKGFRHTLAK